MTRSFLADEHVKRVFVTELRANGFDVKWVDGGYEPGTPDVDHLRRSAEDGFAILSNDTDFLARHDAYDHGGILIYDDQNVSVSAFVRGIKRIDRYVSESELAGNVVWLDSWIE